MSDLKVQPGNALTATLWNSVVDRLPGDSLGAGGAATSVYGQSVIELVNKTTADLELGQVVNIESFSGDDQDEFAVGDALEFEAVTADWHDKVTNLAVVLEPCKADDKFTAVVDGLCLAKVTDQTGDWVFVDPDAPEDCKCGSGGFAQKIGDYGTDYALCLMNRMQNLWRYELTQDSQTPAVTTSKLLNLDGTQYASTMNLDDPDGLMEDQVIGDKGWCLRVGPKFYAIQAVC